MAEVQLILACAREDYRAYFTVRFFTGMRTGEVHGLKWKYIGFERRLTLVRESIVPGDEDELKSEDSQRDIQMTQVVYEALRLQAKSTRKISDYVFCNLAGRRAPVLGCGVDFHGILTRHFHRKLTHPLCEPGGSRCG
nr:tyrosine-type recombinase/integrase [Ramlibacter aquaticus]